MITPYLFDQNLLLALNFDGGSAMDQVMYVISGKLTWVPFYICILWLVYARLGLRTLVLFALAVPLLITCADQTASLAKEYLPKLRPSHFTPIMADVHTVNGYAGGAYGTVSSHAANCFGLALFASLLYKRRWFSAMMCGWAVLVAYSRIYLGVHYPMDILIGTVEGLFWAGIWYGMLRWADNRITTLKRLDRHVPYRLCFLRRWPVVSFLQRKQGLVFASSDYFSFMRRLTAYIPTLCAALLLMFLLAGGTGRGCTLSDSGRVTSERVNAEHTSADFSLPDSYAWYVGPMPDLSSVGSHANGGNAVNGARCTWLTGMRRELSSPVFLATDVFLTYLGRESSARSFASWRASLCGASCAGGISVSRPGDGYVYALRRIVI